MLIKNILKISVCFRVFCEHLNTTNNKNFYKKIIRTENPANHNWGIDLFNLTY